MHSPFPAEILADAADRDACGALLKDGSRTFHAASLALPAVTRRAATGLYAFCRTADDAIDRGGDRAAALVSLHRRLDAVYAGAPADAAVDRAFTEVVFDHGIPKAFPLAMLEGFAWDAENRRYATLADLNNYAVRVAGVVGAMMAMVMGVRDSVGIARSCDLGVAMQLTNIARDVGEDARTGRLYLPLEWLREAGIDADKWSAAPCFSPALGGVIERLLAEADRLYLRCEPGLARLPAACRPAMLAARLLYAEIGHEVRRSGCDSVSGRAVVSWQRKAPLLLRALARAPTLRRPRDGHEDDALPQAKFLLAALRSANAPNRAAGRRVRESRVAWLVDLFERLERMDERERAARGVEASST